MSEPFSDLWASSNPVKSQQPQKLGVAENAPTNVTLRVAPDAFSMLASAGSRPNSKPITPSTKHTLLTSKNDTVAGDAFGGLVSFGTSTSRDGGLTIAERAAKAEREHKERTEKDGLMFNVQGSFWDKFEGLPTSEPSIATAHGKSNDLLGLDFPNPEQTSPSEQLQAEAKGVVAATSTGLDVDAALDSLSQHGGSTSPEEREGDAMKPPKVEPISRQRQGLSRATTPPAHFSPLSSHSEPPLTNQPGLQEQADKLLAQASMIGRTVFSKANAFWKERREQVGKAYQEQRSGFGEEAGMGHRRPKWMDNIRVGEEDGNEFLADESLDWPESKRIPTEPSRSMRDLWPSDQSALLFANDESVYRSPARRRPPVASSSKPQSLSPVHTPATLPLIVRAPIEASLSALAASNTHKAAATDHFKLGRFAEAEEAYSRAIDALPASHLLLIPLYNNRALTRLRTGEYKGTIDDTTEVLRIITGDLGLAWHPGREEVRVREIFGDAIGKTLRRRAEAYEGIEKWRDAAGDWERLSAATWAGLALKGDAVKGADRCKQMASDGFSPTISPKLSLKPKPKPRLEPVPVRISPTRPSELVTRIRAANTSLEKEGQTRHDLKDSVDAHLAAWCTGKENNLRALIASLDVVLSPTFGWQTVGMSELVSPGQVKVKYTKAIAKLHPDKLNVNNTTVEERMVANSVFSILNEAWNAFR